MAVIGRKTVGDAEILYMNSDPNGVESAAAGSVAFQTDGTIHTNTDGSTTWQSYSAGSGGGGGVDAPIVEQIATENIPSSDQALAATLSETPKSDASVLLIFNGAVARQGTGGYYTISGSTITWLAGSTAPPLTTSDTIVVLYLVGSSAAVANQDVITTQAITDADTIMTATLTNLPVNPDTVMLFFGGIWMIPGEFNDYQIIGKTIRWQAKTGSAPAQTTNQDLIAYYMSGSMADTEVGEVLFIDTTLPVDADREVPWSENPLNHSPKYPAALAFFINGIFQHQKNGGDYLLRGREILPQAFYGNFTERDSDDIPYAHYRAIGIETKLTPEPSGGVAGDDVAYAELAAPSDSGTILSVSIVADGDYIIEASANALRDTYQITVTGESTFGFESNANGASITSIMDYRTNLSGNKIINLIQPAGSDTILNASLLVYRVNS